MKLSFHAKGDLLVTVPGHQPRVGQHLRRVGRDRSDNSPVPRPTERPYECDSESEEGLRLAKIARRDQSLWAADRATADHCGIPLRPDLAEKIPATSQES